MDNYSYEILSLLKDQYLKSVGNKKFQISQSGNDISARQFYLETLEDNLIEPMSEEVKCKYECGSGNELKDKMKALRSSSAMTYNIFGNNPKLALFDNRIGKGIYKIEYEKQFHTLNSFVKGMPANLDVFLYSEENKEAVACEMKMAEWILNKPTGLKEAYLIEKNYIDEISSTTFIPIAKKLVEITNNNGVYLNKLKRYDALQMFKHTIACYNASKSKSYKVNKLTLVNCVWELSSINNLNVSDKTKEKYKKEVAEEKLQFDIFYNTIINNAKHLFKTIGVDFDIKYYSLEDFIKIINLSNEEKAYLKRYIF